MNDQAFQLRDMSRKYRDEQDNTQEQAAGANARENRLKIVLGSGKGGVGKSVLAIQLGQALGVLGKKVLVVDANPYSPSLHILTNTHAEITVHDLLSYSHQPEKLQLPEIAPNVDLLSGAAPSSQETYIGSTNAAYFLEALAPHTARYNCIIYDTHTGLDDWNLAIMEACTDVFLVTLTEPASIIDTYSYMKSALQHISTENFWLLISQTLNPQSGIEAQDKLNLALDHFLSYQIPLLGAVPFEYDLKSAIDIQAPFWEKKHSGEAGESIELIVKQYLTKVGALAATSKTREVIL
ncbi:MAG: P-loop NTPase [Calditrichae bacterium]|nr:P-loop NTPase [Calditrichia bacterium]